VVRRWALGKRRRSVGKNILEIIDDIKAYIAKSR
jgi:hypothetical protein